MQKLLFFILIMWAMPILAQDGEWKTIYPLVDCDALPIMYKDNSNGGFTIKINKYSSKSEMIEEVHVDDINDLSELTDQLIEQSEYYCPKDDLKLVNILEPEDTITCGRPTNFFSDDYIEFIRFTADYVNSEGNQCDNIIPFIKFQEEVTELNKQELIKFDKTKSFNYLMLKSLAGLTGNGDSKEMIDQFKACGGKDGSAKFIENMILLEAKKSCVVPAMLSWKDAEIIAKKIANNHQNSNILTLNSKTNDITDRATRAFTEKILHVEINSIMGSTFESNKEIQRISIEKNGKLTEREKKLKTSSNQVIENLSSKKRLDNYDNKKNIADYVSYVFSVDASIEIGKSTIPMFLESTFYNKLPATWSDDKKTKFINDKLIKIADKRYESCMAKRKDFSKYGEILPLPKDHELTKKQKRNGIIKKTKTQKYEDEILKHRLETKDKFCDVEENKSQCDSDNCYGSINLLQMDSSATDTEVVQGCVLQSVTIAINPLLKAIIFDQKNAFKDDFDLSNDLAENFSKTTWDTLMSCANKRVKTKLNIKNNIDIRVDQAPLQKIDTNDYETIMLECSDVAEAEVSRKFVNQVLINNHTVQKAYGDPEIVKEWNKSDQAFKIRISKAKTDDEKKMIKEEWDITDKSFSQQLKDDDNILKLSQDVIHTTYDKCMDKQVKLSKEGYNEINPTHGLKRKNPMLCSTIVEMATSIKVVESSLNDLINEEDLNENIQAQNIVTQLSHCGDNAIGEALDNIGSLTSLTPIDDESDAIDYLDKNPSLFNCVENSISKLSYIIAGKSIDQQLVEQKESVTDLKYFASLKEKTQKVVRECFSNGIQEQKNWSGFSRFNDNDGLDKLKIKCEMEATKYVIPKLVINEAKIEMTPLISDGFLQNKNDIYDIRSLVAVDLRKEYNIPKPKGAELVSYSYGEALQLHIEKGGTEESFIDEISNKLETKTIERVHKNLNTKIRDKSKDVDEKAILTSLPEYFPASCLQTIYSRFIKDAPATDSDPMTLDKLAEYLQTGLSFAYNKSPSYFTDEMKTLKLQCDNMDQFKTEKDFYKSQFYSMIIKGQIYEEFKTEFKKGIMDSLAVQEAELTDPNKVIKIKYMTDMKSRMNVLLDKYLKEGAFNSAIFSDNTVMNFATNNIDGLLTDDPKVKDKLSKLLVSKMFERSGNNSFSDQFAQIQVEGNFGIEGVTEAINEGSKGRTILWGLMSVGQDAGKSAATKYFSQINNIKNVIDWKNIDEGTRKVMASSVYYDGVAENLIKRSKPVDEGDVWGIVSKRDRFVDKSVLGVGYEKYRAKIETMTDDVTNGYKNYENNIETKAKSYAKELLKSYPAGKKKMTEEQLADQIAKDIKSEHMERNVTNMLLNSKNSNGISVENRIKNEIESDASDIFWGNTEEAKKATQKRQFERVTNPWPIGSKL